MYAKDRVQPKIQEIDTEKISKLYTQLRQESKVFSLNNNFPFFFLNLMGKTITKKKKKGWRINCNYSSYDRKYC